MKILHTADWHIGNFSGPEKDGKNLRLLDTLMCIDYLISTADDELPDIAVISGDIFHQAKVWAERGLGETNTAIKKIEQLSEKCPVVVLRGTPNHDGDEQFELLKTHFLSNDSVYVITEPIVKTIQTNSGPIQVAALPGFDRGTYRSKFPGLSKEEENIVFTEELGKIILGLRAECFESLPNVLISHFTVPGCNTESGQVQFLAQFEPVIEPNILAAADFDLVCLGHIHRPQSLANKTFYSGGINTFNFNDGEQERGFWIHELSNKELTNSKFIKTPCRGFITFHFTDTDITGINTGELSNVASNWWKYNRTIEGNIVRVLYSCSDENSKAFNKALLEKQLYDGGAFWVSEISPEKIVISATKNELSEKSDPVANLKEYLLDKGYTLEQIHPIAELAMPIISEALANKITASITGVFEPLEISVKNYRNYEEETFDFRDITFCTINGKNGAGKSSLFMDAILDCLYEEPREGDLTGWIRADESARSGSITFTFRIGEKQFRINRTRAKSGKATLNLSELIDDDWQNRSKEKIKDTQDEIINLLGMDSLTFKSCALIMQDQYGLFLEADKESRMTILGNILGLGIYGDMEDLARDKASDFNRKLKLNSDMQDQLALKIINKIDVISSIALAENDIKDGTNKKAEFVSQKEVVSLKLNSILEAEQRANALNDEITSIQSTASECNIRLTEQNQIIAAADKLLNNEAAIAEGVKKYNHCLGQEKELIQGKALYDSKQKEIADNLTQITDIKTAIIKSDAERNGLISRRDFTLEKTLKESELKADHDNYPIVKIALDEMEKISDKFIQLSDKISVQQNTLNSAQSKFNIEYAQRVSQINTLKEKTKLLDDSGCIDKENAHCEFLKDAQEAKDRVETFTEECKVWKAEQEKSLSEIENTYIGMVNERNDLGYNAVENNNKRIEVSRLLQAFNEYEAIQGYKEQLSLLNERIEAIESDIDISKDTYSRLNQIGADLSIELVGLQKADENYKNVLNELDFYKKWIEEDKLLPVAKEKKATAVIRLQEINTQISDLGTQLLKKQADYGKEKALLSGCDELKTELVNLNNQIFYYEDSIHKKSIELGGFKNQLEDIAKAENEIKELQVLSNEIAEKVAIYEELKKAFSQDGIPHNIIRSIIPQLTATANNILGQMTGGKMGMEFRTEKVLKSNSKKEVVTLDIFIEEVGKSALPYLSKSGGEKVKSALSAILSLAEIKSTSAGIQLGMLFIDEPPFLDSDGIQAYCDALEIIQGRYKTIKIMAITHDPTMKARFPQNLDVIKTENGSKVVFD